MKALIPGPLLLNRDPGRISKEVVRVDKQLGVAYGFFEWQGAVARNTLMLRALVPCLLAVLPRRQRALAPRSINLLPTRNGGRTISAAASSARTAGEGDTGCFC